MSHLDDENDAYDEQYIICNKTMTRTTKENVFYAVKKSCKVPLYSFKHIQ